MVKGTETQTAENHATDSLTAQVILHVGVAELALTTDAKAGQPICGPLCVSPFDGVILSKLASVLAVPIAVGDPIANITFQGFTTYVRSHAFLD
jgi:hypothetical protein